ncbi:alpha/beta hydrolase [Aquimarina sp. 2-A2]|uniref:alpha/beta hydrolase n=1 Tax=Aquimarina sp. 2-A2 TaxID=3382644 RepID=UPI00387F010F
MRIYVSMLFFLLVTISFSQEKEYNSAIIKINPYVEGNLVTPYADDKVPLLIFIMDAGAINRDGNDRMSKNETFKKLSRELAKHGIASFRYDKRIFAMDRMGMRENEISFKNFIDDAIETIDYFEKNNDYSKIILAGHGQGSLVGMIAARDRANAFIGIAGNANSIDNVIIDQLAEQAPGLDKSAALAFKQLRENGRATVYEPALESIFRYDLQPFMRTWLQYNPREEIAQLEIPILLLYGKKDIQVNTSEGEKLKEVAPDAQFVAIDNMNHILREIKGNRLENQKSYNESWRPIMPEVIGTLATFIKDISIQ